MNNKSWFRKGLVVGIIVLLIGMSVLSSVSSKDISVSDEKMLEYDSELEDNNEIEPLDTYYEILSFIEEGQVYIEFKGRGLIRHAEIWTDPYRTIDIRGYKYPTKDDPEFTFHVLATHIIAPLFIGYSYPMFPDYDYVHGIAFGDIEWS